MSAYRKSVLIFNYNIFNSSKSDDFCRFCSEIMCYNDRVGRKYHMTPRGRISAYLPENVLAITKKGEGE